ncbi:hypothetical protein V8C42DRAFT_318396 [Trichoderma barbatum]
MYITSGNNSLPVRLLIRCPELSSNVWSASMFHTSRLSDVMRFVTKIANLENIRPYFVESSSVLGFILSQAKKERLGHPKMTTGTIDQGIRFWMARKGFSDIQDIHKLEELAGSLTLGLIIMLHALAKQSRLKSDQMPFFTSKSQEERYQKQEVRAHERFDIQVHQYIAALVFELAAKQDSYINQLQSQLTRSPEELTVTASHRSSTSTSHQMKPSMVVDEADIDGEPSVEDLVAQLEPSLITSLDEVDGAALLTQATP